MEASSSIPAPENPADSHALRPFCDWPVPAQKDAPRFLGHAVDSSRFADVGSRSRSVRWTKPRSFGTQVKKTMPIVVALFLLVGIASVVGYLFVRSVKLSEAFQAFVRERKLVFSQTCPKELGHPFVYEDLSLCVAYKGHFDPNDSNSQTYYFILGTRQREGAIGHGSKVIFDRYLGIYLPKASLSVPDSWLRNWQEQIAQRGDGWAKHTGLPYTPKDVPLLGWPESMPIVATRTQDQGVFVGWHCLHTVDRMTQRFEEWKKTLPQTTTP